ncbi:MAG: DUF4266 domain-containing protein [Coxiellaceae bacterium]|nr:DUF4266 domain-containing protein [Coxiellaceae bacterium]
MFKLIVTKIVLVLSAALTALILSGCGVKPWQKENLSKRQMYLEPDSVLVQSFKDEGYTGRAISRGGYSVGGGGCGCD